MPRGKKKPVQFLPSGHSQRAYTFFSHSSLKRNDKFEQLEVSVLLSLHRQDPVRSSKIPRCRPSLELPPRKDHCNGTSSLLAKEHIRSGQLGGIIFDRELQVYD